MGRMKTLVAVAAMGASLWAAAPLAEAHEQVAPETCGLRRATIEQAAPHVRVVRRRDSGETNWFACTRLRGTYTRSHVHGYRNRRKLARFDCDDFYGCAYPDVEILDTQNPPRRFVVGSALNCGCSGAFCPGDPQCGVDLAVLSVRSGLRSKIHFHVRERDVERVFDPQLTPGGTAVWIEPVAASKTDKVAGVTLSGEQPVLDEGAENALSDLAVTGQTLYWNNAGEVKSAQVP